MSFERFVYRPNETGNLEYKVPIVCDELCLEISSKIQNLLNQRSDFRKSDKGHGRIENYGYKATEVFYDMENCKGIQLKGNAAAFYQDNPSYHTPLNLEDINKEGAYLIKSFDPFEKGLGKRAFKNRVDSMLDGNYLIKSHKQILNEAMESTKWLKEKYPLRFLKLISGKK